MNQKTLLHPRPNFQQIIGAVLEEFGVEMASITGSQRERREDNIPRLVVMHLDQELCGLTSRQIEEQLGLKGTTLNKVHPL